MNSLRGGSPMIGLQHAPRFGGVSCIAVPSLTSLATCGVERSGFLIGLIGQVVLVFGLSFVATKPKGGGWTRCDLSSWLARSCWFYPGF